VNRWIRLLVACTPALLVLAPVMAQSQADMQLDRDAALAAQQSYLDYGQRVSGYINEVQQRVSAAHAARRVALSRRAQLQASLPGLSGEQRAAARSELGRIDAWLGAERSLDEHASQNMQVCYQWLGHERARMNDAQYNAAEDEQAAADAQRKAQEQAAEQQWQQRLAEGSSYYDQLNGAGGFGGYYPHGYRRGWGHGYRHYHGGHSSSSSSHSGHTGGHAVMGHAGGHR
jgi:hypothetical protein